MSRGRPPLKSALVDALQGPQETKQRLRVILATISGELSIIQACEQLGISETRFFDLRRQALEGALAGIAPGEPGRPAQTESADAAKVKELQRQLDDVKYDLYTAKVRAELAAVLPHVIESGEPAVPLRKSSKKKRRRPRLRG